MEFEKMSIEELETRKAQIAEDCEMEGADLDALTEEIRGINAELETRRNVEAQKAEIRAKVAEGAGVVIQHFEEEKGKPEMTNEEIRNSKEYIDAYAQYIKTGDDKECRTLLTTNASGSVPVPVLVDEIVRTAWERNEILNRVRKTYFRGNLKVAFESAAGAAVAHTEGSTAPSEESLTIGIVTMTPKNIKKWIRISDEAVAMGGEAFVQYIYDEMGYRVLNKLVSELVGKANSANTTHGDTAIGIPKITEAPGVMIVQNAAAQLSEEATDICVVLNPLTIQAFNAAYAAGNFAINPFDGVTVIKCSALPAYSSASDNAMYAIVGDLKAFQANYPEGEGVIIKWDDLTYAEDDMVKVVARQYAGYGVTAPGRLVKLCKPAAAVTT